MPRNKPVFLIGFMGCGKSTLGRAVRGATGIDFTDLDDAVEARAGMSIPQIFKTRGEAAFRALEREVLNDICASGKPVLVACGGGTPCQPGNMELMNRLGVTVWLQAPVERLVERLLLYPGDRPLIAGKSPAELKAYVAATLKGRTEHYGKARHTFDASRLDTVPQLEDSTRRFIAAFLPHLTSKA